MMQRQSQVWFVFLTASFLLVASAPGAAQNPTNDSPVISKDLRIAGTNDGWPDISSFLDKKYGFIPLAIPITEPAVGYGGAGGLAFVDKPLGQALAGFGRPNMTMVGGLGTENGSWGVAAADVRQWLDDRLQSQAGLLYASVNLDYYGIGNDALLHDHPLRYNLEPKGGGLQGKYRLGDSCFWVGLAYAFAATTVSFDSPPGTPGLPPYEHYSNVGGLTPSFTYDSRDSIFTPLSGTYIEATAGCFSEAFGGDTEFQRVRLIAMQYFPLHPKWTLGLRADGAASFGEVPFYMRPFISLRGAPAMRYQGDEIAQLEAELRWQFWQRFSLVGFAGAGAAWNDFDRFDNTQTVVTGGAGFRYELAREYGLHMGLDVAFGPDNTAVYVQFGSAWMRP